MRNVNELKWLWKVKVYGRWIMWWEVSRPVTADAEMVVFKIQGAGLSQNYTCKEQPGSQ